MASISYWFLSPSLILAMIGKLRGWDKVEPTPAVDWKKVVVDVVIPAWNEEKLVALALSTLAGQDFPCRTVTVFDDGSTDRTSRVVERYRELTGRDIRIIRREKSIGKTPSLREFCERTDADAVVILDGDTVLTSPNYISRLIEELYRNAGVAAASGEVTPLTPRRREQIAQADESVRTVQAEFALSTPASESFWYRFLTFLTILYRTPMYILLQRTLFDGTLKLFGGQLNPVGCAVAYKTQRLRECFTYAKPLVGDNLSTSEDIYIGHFFNWKGYRSVQVLGVRCESIEPPITRLPRQLFLWSSAFLQSSYYFIDLPLSPLRLVMRSLRGKRRSSPQQNLPDGQRMIREQYRAAWGEEVTRRDGRPVGLLELVSLFEKIAFPLVLFYFMLFNHEALLLTIFCEALFCMMLILVTADEGKRIRCAAMILPATPVRFLSLGVDVVAAVRFLIDLVAGDRTWRK